MSNTPLYDELEDKWTETFSQRNICDRWWTVHHNQTGQEWFEDDEGNEVFPEPPTAGELNSGLATAGELNSGLDLTAGIVLVEGQYTATEEGFERKPQYAKGGFDKRVDPKLPVKIVNCYIHLDESRIKPKRKFKLFGRNQETQGTL